MAKRCHAEGLLTGVSGNVSMYDPDIFTMAITPTSMLYDQMEVDDIVCIALDGQLVDGKHKPSSEWRMHATIYQRYSSVKAQIHTHSPYATSFAVSGTPIPLILVEMLPLLGGDVKVAKFASAGTAEVGHNALNVLVNRNACLLESHGALAVGGNLEQAYIHATCLEEVAKTYAIALSNGFEIKEIGNDE